MKKLLFSLLVGFGIYKYIFYIPTDTTPIVNDKEVLTDTTKTVPTQKSDQDNTSTIKHQVLYTCDGRQYCSQMRTYEEAKFFLQNCPEVKMDGDDDGIPCERQFERYD